MSGRLVGYGLLVVAAFGAVGGAIGVKWYLWDIVIDEAGEPDRSMIFWGLPVLFLSLAAIGLAVGFAMLGRQWLDRQ